MLAAIGQRHGSRRELARRAGHVNWMQPEIPALAALIKKSGAKGSERKHGTQAIDDRQSAPRQHRDACARNCSSVVSQRLPPGHLAPDQAPEKATWSDPAFTMRSIPAREDLDQISAVRRSEPSAAQGDRELPAGTRARARLPRREACRPRAARSSTTRPEGARRGGPRLDGPVRDSGRDSQMDFPVFCAGGSAPLNLLHHHAIDQNIPIGCGGVAVYPGDVIVGDDEGVVVIPQHLADEVADAGRRAGEDGDVHPSSACRAARSRRHLSAECGDEGRVRGVAEGKEDLIATGVRPPTHPTPDGACPALRRNLVTI